jgi:PKD repeat protein
LENYMSYDDCQMMFTAGQRDRTKAIFNPTTGIPQLLNLVSSTNATFTAIDPTVTVGALKPIAYFGLQNDRVCVGEQVTFTNETYNGAATSYSWSFPGGTPSTSTAVDPIVTYAAPGDYDVTLIATNAAGASAPYTVTKQIHVRGTVNSPVAMPQNQYVESFEDALFPSNANPGRNLELLTQGNLVPSTTNFERTQVAATTGAASIRLRNSTVPTNTVSSLITPNIDVTGNTGNMYLSFDVAYALKAADSDDVLKVFVSSNCGATWSQRYYKFGSTLATNGGAVVNSFIPTSSSQWRTETAIIPSNLTSGGKIMIKVEATSTGGNTLYIDNLRVYTLLGAEEELAKNNINVYPNPVTPETGISFDLQNKEKVSVKIFDLVGNTVYESKETSFGAGSHNLPLYKKMENLKAGMYMVQVKLGNNIYNTKLITQ